jgi:hypothetical protein
MTAICMVTKTNIKCMALSVPEKLEIIKKVESQSYVMQKKIMEQLRIPVSVLDNIMANKKNILHPGRRKVKNFYEKTESVHLEWFWQK